MSKTAETKQPTLTEQMFAELFENLDNCYRWAKTNSVSDDDKQIVEDFKNNFKNTMYDALKNNEMNEIGQFNSSVVNFMVEHNIPVSTLKPEVLNNGNGGRRRKSASSSSRPRRRSSKKRGTQRKQKRRQRRGSRRA